LIALADEVINELSRVKPVVSKRWGLNLNRSVLGNRVDLQGLSADHFDPPSGWPALAAGLWLAAHNILPKPGIWATGNWVQARKGFGTIGFLEQKLNLALDWKNVTDVFVPATQADAADKWKKEQATSIKLHYLESSGTDLTSVLNRYLIALGSPPTIHDPFEARRNYYRLDASNLKAYYLDTLLPDILNDQREWVQKNWTDFPITHFVGMISFSPELSILGPYMAGAKKVLLFHTPDLLKETEIVITRLKNLGIGDCELCPFKAGERMAPQFEPPLQKFIADVGCPDNLVFDMTPGKTLMKRALGDLAPEGSWLLYLEHDFRRDRHADPGTEYPVRRRAGTPEAPRLTIAHHSG
jgi:hypothetical protein